MNRTLIVDSRLCADSENKLTLLGYNLLKIQKNELLDEPVSCHPDMNCVKIGYTWVVDAMYAHLFANEREVITVNREGAQKLKYPNDVGFNCAVVGKHLLCNKNYALPEILSLAEKYEMDVIHVNQGYAKCSVCVVDNNSIITEDESIYNASTKCGIDALKIQKGNVKLFGYDYGFIGGASGLIEENILVFNGNVLLHREYDKIKEFCDNKKVQILSLNGGALYDIGTILRL